MLMPPPLSLYVHLPWCVRKCPYCDFNSHEGKGALPFDDYIDALIRDLEHDLPLVWGRTVHSVFFGGGTPSLFAPEHIERFLQAASARLRIAPGAEITLETNPGTVEHGPFAGYRKAGVNRLSFGVQSFDDGCLTRLGRIHTSGDAERAVKAAQDAGFDNLNLDLMYALPEQTLAMAEADVERAIALAPTHLSHYQLTLEPNTLFAAKPPPGIPDDDLGWDMQERCQALMADAGFAQYEVSAYAQPGRQCAHNLNYWTFGDYLGIGAGAHGKLTLGSDQRILRRWKHKHPATYLQHAGTAAAIGGDEDIGPDRLAFDFMLNALRLNAGFKLELFEKRTGLERSAIATELNSAMANGWLEIDPEGHALPTELGRRFTNDVIGLFLPGYAGTHRLPPRRRYDAAMGEQRDIASLADSGLPPRVREVAELLLQATQSELGERIELMLEQFETQLFKQAERARSPTEQADLLKAVQAIKTRRGQFKPEYFKSLESQLAHLRSPASAQAGTVPQGSVPSSLWTVRDSAPETDVADAQLRDLASPVESTANLSLYLLGQRFGVLAGAPAFSPAKICLGPRTLIRLAGEVADKVFDSRVSTATLQSHFTQQVLGDYVGFLDRINEALDTARVLPGLTYVPVRPTKASKGNQASRAQAEQDVSTHKESHAASSQAPSYGRADTQAGNQHANQPAAAAPTWGRDDVTGWLEQPAHTPLVPQSPPADFRYLQQLLTAHRIAGKLPPRPTPPPGSEIDTSEVDRLLHEIQSQPPASANQARSIHGLRESLLQRARAEHGPMANLGREDADTFEILSLLYAEVAREVRAGSSVHGLLERLQLPVLRLALKDRSFFEEAAHPGRQLLNTIAESDASAYGDNAVDPYFETAMRKAVERMEDDFHGQPEVLNEVNDELQTQFRQQVKRSQSNEKRLIEAARGRERMALAKQTATTALQALIDKKKPPRAIEVLMRRAWLDAMTLTALRHGEESPAWQKQLETTRQILDTVNSPEPVQSPELAKDIDAAMRRVGYHETEASALSQHLSRSSSAPRKEDEPTATEITTRIKAHTRLGEDDAETRNEKVERAKLTPRSPEEEECYRHLRTLPFGCWIDFIQNQQGEAERRRLSWYSTVTDRALFVNRRGQRVADIHMDTLSRLMAQGQLRVVERTQLRLIDRAFRSTVEMLRSTLRGNDEPKSAQWKAPA